MTWLYLNLTRFYFRVPYGLCIEKNNNKKGEKILDAKEGFEGF